MLRTCLIRSQWGVGAFRRLAPQLLPAGVAQWVERYTCEPDLEICVRSNPKRVRHFVLKCAVCFPRSGGFNGLHVIGCEWMSRDRKAERGYVGLASESASRPSPVSLQVSCVSMLSVAS